MVEIEIPLELRGIKLYAVEKKNLAFLYELGERGHSPTFRNLWKHVFKNKEIYDPLWSPPPPKEYIKNMFDEFVAHGVLTKRKKLIFFSEFGFPEETVHALKLDDKPQREWYTLAAKYRGQYPTPDSVEVCVPIPAKKPLVS